MKKNILIILAAFLVIASCSKSGGGDNGGGGGGGSCQVNCSGVASGFAATVNPIIQTKCATDATCHGTGSGNGPGPLKTHTDIFNARLAIRSAVCNGTMPKPPGTPLTTAEKNSIICWVDAGGPNN